MTDWYPWYYARYKADTIHLTLEEDGLYRRFIDYYMETRLPLPDDENALARIAGIGIELLKKLLPEIKVFFRLQNGKLHNSKCDEELKTQSRLNKKRKRSGKAGAEKRWAKKLKIKDNDENSNCHSGTIAEHMAKNATVHNSTAKQVSKKESILTEIVDRSGAAKISERLNLNEFANACAVLCALLGFQRLSPRDQETIGLWLTKYDIRAFVLPNIEKSLQIYVKKNGTSPKSLRYFDKMLEEKAA